MDQVEFDEQMENERRLTEEYGVDEEGNRCEPMPSRYGRTRAELKGSGKVSKKQFSIHDVAPGQTFPIKVQMPLSGDGGVLVYSKDRVPLTMADGAMPLEFGYRVLGDRVKGYFNAHITPAGELSIDCEIPDQNW